MIIVNIVGGLGNQLFQYAMGRRLAAQRKTQLLLDSSGYSKPETGTHPGHRQLHLFNFRIHAREATDAEITKLRDPFITMAATDRAVRLARRIFPSLLWPKSHIVERQYRFQTDALSLPDNVYLSGFWQSEKYFADIAPMIREEFRLVNDSITDRASAMVDQVRQLYGSVVSLHVRRGDLTYAFETLRQKHLVHGPPLGLEYYNQAILRFDPACCFFVFSDSPEDIQWCKRNIRANNLKFSDATSELLDFAAMSACDHHIIANSSFSWWAAWLDSKSTRRVVAPSMWSGPEAKTEMVTDDLIPSGWEII